MKLSKALMQLWLWIKTCTQQILLHSKWSHLSEQSHAICTPIEHQVLHKSFTFEWKLSKHFADYQFHFCFSPWAFQKQLFRSTFSFIYFSRSDIFRHIESRNLLVGWVVTQYFTKNIIFCHFGDTFRLLAPQLDVSHTEKGGGERRN